MRSPVPLALLCLAAFLAVASPARARPNVVLIMTDDQGWGDLGVHGNDAIRTPHLDALARQGVRFTRFYAGPVCTPTRASLMTGRYHLRTRAIDTYRGRAVMHPDEVTLAETLAAAGYRTGIFGKWHLGDHHPSRPIDQGFAEALVHWGGGIAQPADPPQGNSYFDPWLEHNGKLVQTYGYCSDVYTDAALRFIDDAGARDQARKPFFLYLAFNAPHDPLQVSDDLARPYRAAGLDEQTAKVYAMVENIDANVGRVLARLDERKLADDTLVLFLTDNGPAGPRFNGGLRAAKGSVYEGGIRVPCFVRWPARFAGGRTLDRVAAHIDLAPTVLAACDVPPPPDVKLDGVSLLPLLDGAEVAWPDRTLYFQWHRGDAADRGRACAAVSDRYKLVQPQGVEEGPAPKDAPWELYDLAADPGEQHDLAAAMPERVARMRAGYDAWFTDISATRGYGPVPISLGTPHENPVLLTRQDWRGAGWGKTDAGHWDVHVAAAGAYKVTLLFDPADAPRRATLGAGGQSVGADVPAGTAEHTFERVDMPRGDSRITARLDAAGTTSGVRYVRVERIE
jgi:arylsulfatase/arylsulfatase A